MSLFAESTVEEAALEWLQGLDYQILYGPNIGPGELFQERDTYQDVILKERLYAALERLNHGIPDTAIEEAFNKLLRPESPALIINNRTFHKILIHGVEVEYLQDGRIVGDIVRVVDFDDKTNNDWLAVNQYTVVENGIERRPDIVIFINGLPLAVIELKNPGDEDATMWTAYKQLQTYKQQISSLFIYNEILVISDGLETRFGSLTAGADRFQRWRTMDGENIAPNTIPELQVLLNGLFDQDRLLKYLRHFILFEDDGEEIVKKLAGYHQYHAVNSALNSTIDAIRPGGDRQVGVVWHTQGSGKSLTMVFYTGIIVLHPDLKNPTIVVITDRNDLDGQLYNTFSINQQILRQTPQQAEDRNHLRDLLEVASGGIIFTTIQKFFLDKEKEETTHPLLSDRSNIIVIADEAHRSQYDFIDGFARRLREALPNASYIGFTGTPIEMTDRNTRAVFGDYISIYDIHQAVEDGATVPIYYEGRMAKLKLKEELKPSLDPEFEEVTEDEELTKREKLKTKWSQLEAVVGSEERVNSVAEDLIAHFEKRLEAMDGKAMVVCMSRRICVEMYNAITKLRPDWHDEDDSKGGIKVVMTGSASDDETWQQHIRNKKRRDDLAKRFKDPKDPLKIVLVRDMWLTGFDVPCLHSMYIDKPMKGHGLMQAIARVNRVFKDKPGGLVVDYLGIAGYLKTAMATYTNSGGKGRPHLDQNEAAAVMLEKYELCVQMFHGFDYFLFITGTAVQKMAILPQAQEHILSQDKGKERFLDAVVALSKAFALAVPHEEAMRIRDEVSFFQTLKGALAKKTLRQAKSDVDMDQAIQQLVSKAIAPEGVIDIFTAAGLKTPDISILSDEFLAEIQGIPQRNLAVELLQKLLNDEIKSRSRRNVVQARSFSDLLERSIQKYHNKSIETAQVIAELIRLAKEMRDAYARGEKLGLSDDELAFYDALEVNDSAVKILGDDILRIIAQELTQMIRKNITIDWSVRENVRAQMRVLVKRVLRKYGYPPDKQEKATQLVIEQAEVLCKDWEK